MVRLSDNSLIAKRRRKEADAQWGRSIGVPYETFLEADRLVQTGFPFGSIGKFQKSSGLTLERIKQLTRMSEGSFNRRKKSRRLSTGESERLLRLSRIFERALTLFGGDEDEARRWLATPIPSLGDQRPLDLSRTEPGARGVEDLIGRIEHGVIS